MKSLLTKTYSEMVDELLGSDGVKQVIEALEEEKDDALLINVTTNVMFTKLERQPILQLEFSDNQDSVITIFGLQSFLVNFSKLPLSSGKVCLEYSEIADIFYLEFIDLTGKGHLVSFCSPNLNGQTKHSFYFNKVVARTLWNDIQEIGFEVVTA